MLEILFIWDWRKWDFAGEQKLVFEDVFFFTSGMVEKKTRCHYWQHNPQKKTHTHNTSNNNDGNNKMVDNDDILS